jgi:hypothetical protein
VALRERGQHLADPLGAGDGVELVATLGEPGRCVEVVVGAERHDEHVGLVNLAVRGDAPRFRIERGDRLLHEAHARLCDVAVGEPNRFRRRAAEHHVQLCVAEDERVALVDQRHVDVVAKRLGQAARELEAAEPRSEDDHTARHLSDRMRLRGSRRARVE